MSSSKLIFIVGPTAVGKSQTASLLAQRINGEIISVDAMQVYQEVSVLSCKPDRKMRAVIPHHLMDVVSVKQNFDVMQFNIQALAALKEILARKKVPIFVGGSGLYMSVLLDGLFLGAPKNEEVREQLVLIAQTRGLKVLYQELEKKDPVAAYKIHPNDLKRIVRALEVTLSQGQPISTLQQKRAGLFGQYPIQIFCLNQERQKLYDTINHRVELMFEQGAVEEVKALKDVSLSLTAQKIIGIKEIKNYLKGDVTLDQVKQAIQQSTRQYAKRQLTWFRKDKRLCWVNVGDAGVDNLVAEIINKIER